MRMPETRRPVMVVGALALAVMVASADYEVRPGDTLAEIAAQHGTTVSALVETNAISNPDLIRPGQTLVIPGESSQAAVHVVQPGETLGGIALIYGTTVQALVDVNGLPNPDVVRAGLELILDAPVLPPEPPPPAQEAAPVTHVVEPGESLASIASRYGTTAEALAAANGITAPSVIYSGTTLVITDRPAEVITGGAGTANHVVDSGETLAFLAVRYGTTVADLATINDLANPNLIRIGQSLRVPSTDWVCPVAGARYFNDWGFPRSGGRFHQGTDMFAPRGTEVRAPVSGVVELKTGTIGGLQIWMQGDDGHLYIGTHLDAFGAAGRVEAGDVIGYVGDSGNAVGSSPHVHMEIHVEGVPVNPYPTLQANGC